MYQASYYDKNTNTIHIWDDIKGHIKFLFKRYGYKKSATGKLVALDGNKVEKVTSWSKEDESKGIMYESDLRPELRSLIDLYYETDDVSTNHREMFLDIEVSSEGGYSTTANVKNPITAISFCMRNENNYYALLLDTERRLQNRTEENLLLYRFDTEEELLQAFLGLYTEKAPTIITGWNIDYYDIPYLYRRIEKVFDVQHANLLSPINIVEFDDRAERYKIAGVSCLDYLGLYKLYTYSEEVSYSLESISQKELGKGKIQHDGTLDHLFNTDIHKFIEYNINDVRLVMELDDKLKFIELAKGVAHKGHVPYEDVYKTTRYLDGACLVFMKRLGIVAPNIKRSKKVEDSDQTDSGGDFAGAYVKDPIPGRYEWIFDVDMGSLYPSIIRTLGISPETKVNRITNWDDVSKYFIQNDDTTANKPVILNGKKSDILIKDFRNWLISNTYTVSSIGVIYDKKTSGIIPSILKTWMQERDDNRALAKKYGQEGDMVKRNFYDGRQLTMKIINNSLYGALGSGGFRFYDLDNAESITLTGQSILKNHVEIKINEWFNKYVGDSGDNVIYVDTDSSFVSASPVIESMQQKLGRPLTYDEKASATFKTAIAVEDYINNSFTAYTIHHHNTDTHVLNIKQEYVGEAGFWIAKKRYAQKIVMEKGVSINDMTKGKKQWKLDVKGMDVVRSNFPKAFREFMSNMLVNILDGEPKELLDDKIIKFRETVNTSPILDIMFPTGIKELSKYGFDASNPFVRFKGTTAHAKAALNYNALLLKHKINSKPPISDGTKIKWGYLKSNSLNLESMALTGFDDPTPIVDFVEQYIDREAIFDSALLLKLQAFYDALNFGMIPKNNNLDDFFSF